MKGLKIYNKYPLRIIAVFLLALMFINSAPLSVIILWAANESEDGVVIRVCDDQGRTVSGAAVEYRVTGTGSAVQIKLTNQNGIVQVLAKDDFGAGLSVSAKITCPGFITDTSTVSGTAITVADQIIDVQLLPVPQKSDFQVIPADNLVYTGQVQNLLQSVEGLGAADHVQYQVNGNGWQDQQPTAVAAGDYQLRVKIIRRTEEVELDPITVTISKAAQVMKFKNYAEPNEEIVISGLIPATGKQFDFLAVSAVQTQPLTGGAVGYSLELAPEHAGIASIDGATGELTVFQSGQLKVKARLNSTNPNFESVQIECLLTIKQQAEYPGQFINFPQPNMDYTLSFQSSTISSQQVINHLPGSNKVVYSIDQVTGLSCNATTGAITITDYQLLAQMLEAGNGQVTVNVKAELKAGPLLVVFPGRENADEASYTIRIAYAELPESPYSLVGDIGENNWFISDVRVLPKAGYRIAKILDLSQFTDHVIINDTTETPRKIYLLENSSRNIIKPLVLDQIKVDTVKPGLTEISYSEAKHQIPILPKEYRYYQDKVKLVFQGVDTGSGIEAFHWKYQREHQANPANIDHDLGVVEAIQYENDRTKYYGVLWLPKNVATQMRGHISVSAKDIAGLSSDEVEDTDKIIVVDTIAPVSVVEYQMLNPAGKQNRKNGIHYYSDSVEVSVKITENNFYGEDVELWLTENGVSAKLENMIWQSTGNAGEYQTKLMLTNESEYQIALKYTDRSNNEMTSYYSDLHVIDRTVPKLFCNYHNHLDSGYPQTLEITVEEKNFDKSDIKIKTKIHDINGVEILGPDLQSVLRNAEWKSEGKIHTVLLSNELSDGIYDLIIDYKDLALHPAERLLTGKFIVDRSPAVLTEMSIDYSLPVYKMMLSDLTFGFYNPAVTVTLHARDEVSGINFFEWSYQRQEEASIKNLYSYADTVLPAVQDNVDKAAFSAEFTLPKSRADQLRGSISFTATDMVGNKSDKKADNKHIIVVDTIAPNMTAQYSSPVKKVGAKMYYQEPVEVRLNVTEFNFYKEDVKVELIKDKKPMAVDVKWLSMSTDEHLGKFTIPAAADHSSDGDYQVVVSYRDKSGNAMPKYTSDWIVIDTTRPQIEVVYENTEPVNILTDAEGHLRSYYGQTQVATIKIHEHNFAPENANLKITAQDVSGTFLEAEKLSIRSHWSSRGDEHSMTIIYPGDANYSFDIAYSDLADNPAAKRETDYFTVDTTAPSELTISYSQSLTDSVLEAVTFGYYNAKMTVTVSAGDTISGIGGFRYHYRNGTKDTGEYEIGGAGIKYSADRQGATMVFEVPKSTEQFNDSIDFCALDYAGNVSDYYRDNRRIVVDSIAPNATVQYNEAVKKESGISYYAGNVSATILVVESNFYAEDVKLQVNHEGREISVPITWSSNGAAHIGSFTLTEDGDYLVRITYTDRSQNQMAEYVSEQIVIDTEITEAAILINGQDADGKSFKDEVMPIISFEDRNFDSYEIKVVRTNLHENKKDVTGDFFKDDIRLHITGGYGEWKDFAQTVENDGIYTISVLIRDKVGHEAVKEVTFSVNRFGSVYQYNDYLNHLIQNGGEYVKEITEDLVITEYNASRLLPGSLDINISLDGKPLENIVFSQDRLTDAGELKENAWNRYQYRIARQNFEKEGTYKIAVSSRDEAGNYPENNNYRNKEILFYVDKTAPEINSIVGLEQPIINAVEVEVKYTLYDTIGLKSVLIYVSGEEVKRITDFQEDRNQYGGSFSLKEKPAGQMVRIVVEDLAGNITDTQAGDFSSKYTVNTTVIVSTNIFVRWYANKKIFWGSLAGVLVFISGFSYVFTAKKRLSNA
ncbi:hypothetical protein EII17_00655 [Clostridiales bacterium COT073_COT-073]|nr:hypothetical protein EII17_00655 [Clostridiales bacterium COT073_COT-073]